MPGSDATRTVVMVVPNALDRDARVQKTSASVAALGFDVTVLWADAADGVRTEGAIGDVKTIGVPIRTPRTASDRRRAALGRRSNRRRTLASRHDPVSRVRAKALAFMDRIANKRSRMKLARGVNWRRELPNITVITEAFAGEVAALGPDILHVHDVHTLDLGARAKSDAASAGRDLRVIYDAHEYVAGMTGDDAIAHAGYVALEREFIGVADEVITVSEPIAELLAADHALARTPSVTMNVPDVKTPVAVDTTVREAAGVDQKTPLLVYTGVVNKLRNVDVLVRALVHVPEAHLAVVCMPSATAPGALALGESAATLGVADRVHLLESVPPRTVSSFITDADVGMHPMITGVPNHEMALPNKIFDYLHAGVPIAVSGVKLVSEFVERNKVGAIFDPTDERSVAAAVTAVLKDKAAFRKAIRSGDLRKRYSWKAQEPVLKGLYSRL